MALCRLLGFLAYAAIDNAASNLARASITTGFGFWNDIAGFDISQTLIYYSAETSTYGRAFWVGLLNTLLVAGLGVVFATMLGFLIGIARLSTNWLVARIAAAYVEIVRNIPLLLQLLFWYNAVLKALPEVRASVALPGGGFLNNRGLFLPRPELGGARCDHAGAARRPRCGARVLAVAGPLAAARRRACRARRDGAARAWSAGRGFPGHGRAALHSFIRRSAGSTSAAASRYCRNSPRCSPGS